MAAGEQIWTALACSEGASDRMRRWLTRQLAQLRVELARRDEIGMPCLNRRAQQRETLAALLQCLWRRRQVLHVCSDDLAAQWSAYSAQRVSEPSV